MNKKTVFQKKKVCYLVSYFRELWTIVSKSTDASEMIIWPADSMGLCWCSVCIFPFQKRKKPPKNAQQNVIYSSSVNDIRQNGINCHYNNHSFNVNWGMLWMWWEGTMIFGLFFSPIYLVYGSLMLGGNICYVIWRSSQLEQDRLQIHQKSPSLFCFLTLIYGWQSGMIKNPKQMSF